MRLQYAENIFFIKFIRLKDYRIVTDATDTHQLLIEPRTERQTAHRLQFQEQTYNNKDKKKIMVSCKAVDIYIFYAEPKIPKGRRNTNYMRYLSEKMVLIVLGYFVKHKPRLKQNSVARSKDIFEKIVIHKCSLH